MKYVFRTVLPIICGFAVCANVSHLVPINPDFEASWLKVCIALLIGLTTPLWADK